MHRIQGMVLVAAPLAACYAEWMRFEDYPHYMKRIASVSRREVRLDAQLRRAGAIDNTEWAFGVRGPFGRIYTITAFIDYLEPEKCLSWATLETEEQTDVVSSGTVNFLQPHGSQEQTLIEVTMSYSPNGLLADFITDVTAYGDNVLNECLKDFKRHAEHTYRLQRDLQIQNASRPSL
jgi:uncharacterized membrane protein